MCICTQKTNAYLKCIRKTQTKTRPLRYPTPCGGNAAAASYIHKTWQLHTQAESFAASCVGEGKKKRAWGIRYLEQVQSGKQVQAQLQETFRLNYSFFPTLGLSFSFKLISHGIWVSGYLRRRSYDTLLGISTARIVNKWNIKNIKNKV